LRLPAIRLMPPIPANPAFSGITLNSSAVAPEILLLPAAKMIILINMVEDNEERIADKEAEAYKKDRDLDEKLSSENPDRVEVFNRRADSKREKYSRDNYYESQDGHESEKMARQD
jgi:hypothetical protein